MVVQTNPAQQEAHEMLSTKIRTTIVALVAAGSITAASLAPAVSLAQTNNFAFLHSAEGYKLKTQGNYMPCQPLSPVEGSGVPTGPLPVGGGPVTRAGATAVTNAQQETRTTLGPLETQTCDEAAQIAN
jgi:hypothetical protein